MIYNLLVIFCYALIALQNGDKRTKKEVIKSFGLNRTIKDKKLSLVANEWYSEIRKGYFSIKEVLAEYEPEIRSEIRTIDDFPTLRSMMRDLVNNVRTALKNYDGLIYIPDLRAYMVIEVKHPGTITSPETIRDDSKEVPVNNTLSLSRTNL